MASAAPVLDTGGLLYSTLNHRSAAIINRVPGSICKTPTSHHCALIGAELARFHLAGGDYVAKRNNPCGLDWYVKMAEKLDSVLSNSDRQLLHEEIDTYLQYPFTRLPQGAIHADLFHDNALFDGNYLGGIIDFDYACHGTSIYDLAVVINDWCLLTNAQLDSERVNSLLKAYDQIRHLENEEHGALSLMLRVGALRFWLSRLNDLHFPLAGELTFTKDPAEFRDMLILRRGSLSISA